MCGSCFEGSIWKEGGVEAKFVEKYCEFYSEGHLDGWMDRRPSS